VRPWYGSRCSDQHGGEFGRSAGDLLGASVSCGTRGKERIGAGGGIKETRANGDAQAMVSAGDGYQITHLLHAAIQ
jgi:hypothetical protein